MEKRKVEEPVTGESGEDIWPVWDTDNHQWIADSISNAEAKRIAAIPQMLDHIKEFINYMSDDDGVKHWRMELEAFLDEHNT